MEKKNQTGITLVAVVVTIVVLLILAGVSINLVIGQNGLINRAKEAVKKTQEAIRNEEKEMSIANEFINKAKLKWIQTGVKITENNENGENITLHVGDKIDYATSEYSGNWYILGVSNEGNLIITTAENLENVQLEGEEGYLTGIETLNEIAKKYANGNNADVTFSRSINVDDINKITGYNPKNIGKIDYEQENEGVYFDNGKMGKFGNIVTYNWNKNYKNPIGAWNENGNENIVELEESNNNFYYENSNEFKNKEKTEENSEICVETSNYYFYYPNSLTINNEENDKYISENSSNEYNKKAYKLLFGNKNESYWLASRCTYTEERFLCYGFRCVWNGLVASSNFVYSNGNFMARKNGIRPAVYLNKNVELTKMGENSWHIK